MELSTQPNYVKLNLAHYLPELVKIIADSNFPWNKIDKLFTERLKELEKKCNGGTIMIEACIYDIIVEAKKENMQAIGLLHFLNEIFKKLSNCLSTQEQILIRKNVEDMLVSFDIKYLNYVGELATLNNLIASKIYRLVEIETELPNGRSIDFKLLHLKTGKFYLVEILNIHLDSDKIDSNPEAIEKFLTYRLEKKLEQKKLNLPQDIEFYLVPVLWGARDDIKTFSEFFKTNKLKLKPVTEPVSYLTYSDGKGYYEHHFKNVSNLFKTTDV